MQALQRLWVAGLLGAFLLPGAFVGCGEVSSDSGAESVEDIDTESSDFEDETGSGEQTEDTDSPEVVYAAYCAGCHGADGEGTDQGYQLHQPVTGYATWVVRNGRPGTPFSMAMPAFNEDLIDGATLNSILDWLKGQPKPTDGESLYLTYCGNCHGPTGRGGVVREGLTHDAQDEPEEMLAMVRRGSGADRYEARGSYMPSWSQTELTDHEVWLIVDFLRGGDGTAAPPWGEGEHEDDAHDSD